ncbi:alanine or glycine:cation symporter, AGCS family, partial [Pseudomonas benzenivorans]
GTVFAFADVTMGLLAIVNLVALTLLFKVGLRLMRDYDGQIEAGVESPVFDPKQFADLDLDPAAWPASPPQAAPGVGASAPANALQQR